MKKSIHHIIGQLEGLWLVLETSRTPVAEVHREGALLILGEAIEFLDEEIRARGEDLVGCGCKGTRGPV